MSMKQTKILNNAIARMLTPASPGSNNKPSHVSPKENISVNIINGPSHFSVNTNTLQLYYQQLVSQCYHHTSTWNIALQRDHCSHEYHWGSGSYIYIDIVT